MKADYFNVSQPHNHLWSVDEQHQASAAMATVYIYVCAGNFVSAISEYKCRAIIKRNVRRLTTEER